MRSRPTWTFLPLVTLPWNHAVRITHLTGVGMQACVYIMRKYGIFDIWMLRAHTLSRVHLHCGTAGIYLGHTTTSPFKLLFLPPVLQQWTDVCGSYTCICIDNMKAFEPGILPQLQLWHLGWSSRSAKNSWHDFLTSSRATWIWQTARHDHTMKPDKVRKLPVPDMFVSSLGLTRPHFAPQPTTYPAPLLF